MASSRVNVSAARLRLANSCRNQRPRGDSITAPSIASYSWRGNAAALPSFPDDLITNPYSQLTNRSLARACSGKLHFDGKRIRRGGLSRKLVSVWLGGLSLSP